MINEIGEIRQKPKKISKSFILANILDAIITGLVIWAGGVEHNPIVTRYGWVIGGVAKLLAVIMVVVIFERTKIYKAYWIAPILIWGAVIWNTINLFALVPMAWIASVLLVAWGIMIVGLYDLVKEIGIIKAAGCVVIYPLLILATVLVYVKVY
jgi:hypothetical protein